MSVRILTATLATLTVGMVGCGTPPPRVVEPPGQVVTTEQQPPLRQMADPTLPAASNVSAIHMSAVPMAEGSVLPLAQILELARHATPNRAVFEANRAAATAAVSQAGTWANPEIEFGLGRARTREADANGDRTTTTIGGVRISQRFELPGKRSSRIAAAGANRSLTDHSAALDALDLELDVRSAAAAVYIADLHLAQAMAGKALSMQVHALVESRHRAGEADQGDVARATAELITAQLLVDAATRDGDAARAALQTWCGQALPSRFTLADAVPEELDAVPFADAQHTALSAHPRLALLAAQSSVAAASVKREERAWYPDLTVGVSESRETDTNDIGVSLGMEIPLWNRNDGGIAQAQAEVARVTAERHREISTLQRQVLAAWNTYERERHQVNGLTQELLPASREALRVKLAAYAVGDAAVFDVIDAKRSLMTAEESRLDAISRATAARLELARAIGAMMPVPGAAPATGESTSLPTSPSSSLPTGVQP